MSFHSYLCYIPNWLAKRSHKHPRPMPRPDRLSHAWGPVCDQLEARVLLSTFHVYVAGPRRTPSGSATTLKLYSTGESVSTYTVTWPDGHVDHPTVATPITTDSYTITGGLTGEQTVSVTATSTLSHNATAVYALDSDFGNFPGSGGGENVFTPSSSTSTSAFDVVVDQGHSDNVYTIESYPPSGSTAEFGITRLSNTGVIDTTFGQTGHLGTYVVPSFGGGSDVPVRATLDGTTLVVVGHCTDGWAAASIDVTGAGSANWNTGTTFETSGQANAAFIISGDSYIVGTNGTNMTAIEVDNTGAKVSTFGTSGVKTYSFPSSTGSDALAIAQNPDNNDLVLAGWESFTYNGGACTGCSFAVLYASDSDGSLDQFSGNNGTCTINVGCTAFVHAIHGCNGTGNPSQDVAYSLVPDPSNVDLMAIGTTSFGYLAVAAFAEVNGNLDTTNFSTTGLGVSTTTASQSDGGGAVDTKASGTYEGDIYSVGQSSSGDFLVDRFSPSSSSTYAALDTTFGSSGEDTLDFGTTSANTTDTAWGVGLESDETAVVAGQTTSSTGKVAVARFIQRNTLLIASSGNSPPKTASVFSSGPNISVPSSAASDAISIDPTGQQKHHTKRGARILFSG